MTKDCSTQEPLKWEPCLVAPRRGIAFFDGIRIETDSIFDYRENKVLAILEEEQIYMCRKMRHTFKDLKERGHFNPKNVPLALDIGTGSGVFAIYAAVHCGCKVLAIDISSRAISFTKFNASLNKFTRVKVFKERTGQERFEAEKDGSWQSVSKEDICKSKPILYEDNVDEKRDWDVLPTLQWMLSDENAPAGIYVIRADFKSLGNPAGIDTSMRTKAENVFWNLIVKSTKSKNPFDAVFLAPPYNPTFPYLKNPPATHAEAGEDGQKCFREQIKWAASLIKIGGICIGNQMTLVPESRKNEPKEAEKESVAAKIIGTAFDEKCELKVTRILKDSYPVGDFLKYMYKEYKVRYPEEYNNYLTKPWVSDSEFSLIYYVVIKKIEKREDKEIQFYSDACTKKIWQNRKDLHRSIVQHTGPSDLLPIPFFLSGGGGSSASIHDNTILPQPQSEKEPPKVWTDSPLYAASQWIEDSKLIRRNVYESDEQERETEEIFNTFDLIVIDCAPYYGAAERTGTLYQESLIRLSDKVVNDDKKGTVLKIRKLWNDNTTIQQQTSTGPFKHPAFACADEKEQWPKVNIHVSARGVTQVKSEDLPDKEIRKQSDQISNTNFNIFNDKKPSQSDKEDIDQSSESCLPDEGYFRQDLSDLEVEQAKQDEYWKRINSNHISAEWDLRACHRAMQSTLDKIILDDEKLKKSSTILIGIPIAFRPTTSSKEKIPSSYKGGVWIYAATQEEFTIEHERKLLQLGRLLWMRYSEKYDQIVLKEAQGEAKSEGQADVVGAFSHEVGKIGQALMLGFVKRADFLLSELTLKTIKNELHLTLSSQGETDTQPKFNVSDWQVSVTQRLYSGMRNLFLIWGGSRGLEDALVYEFQNFLPTQTANLSDISLAESLHIILLPIALRSAYARWACESIPKDTNGKEAYLKYGFLCEQGLSKMEKAIDKHCVVRIAQSQNLKLYEIIGHDGSDGSRKRLNLLIGLFTAALSNAFFHALRSNRSSNADPLGLNDEYHLQIVVRAEDNKNRHSEGLCFEIINNYFSDGSTAARQADFTKGTFKVMNYCLDILGGKLIEGNTYDSKKHLAHTKEFSTRFIVPVKLRLSENVNE